MNFFQRLFSQPKVQVKPEEPVKAEAEEQSHLAATGNISRLPPGIHIGKISDIGRERERNEDSFFVFNALLQHDYGQESFGLIIVADGMGGHQKGEVASSLATRTVANQILKDVYLPYLCHDNQTSANKPINEVLIAAVEGANTAVLEAVPEGGTTLTAALIMGNNAYIAHIGDTRVYFLTRDEIKQITKDHSLAQRLEELGQGTSTELAKIQNVLYRAIGQSGAVEVDTFIQRLTPASSLLMCSDGLWGLVGADTLKKIVTNSVTPQEACEQLVATANENGGYDNITAVIVTIGVET
jgi:protein phosphatase